MAMVVQIWVPVSALPSLFLDVAMACFDVSASSGSHTVHSHWLQPGEKEASLADDIAGAGAAAEEDGTTTWITNRSKHTQMTAQRGGGGEGVRRWSNLVVWWKK